MLAQHKNLHAEVGVSDPAAEPVSTDYCPTVLGLLSKKRLAFHGFRWAVHTSRGSSHRRSGERTWQTQEEICGDHKAWHHFEQLLGSRQAQIFRGVVWDPFLLIIIFSPYTLYTTPQNYQDMPKVFKGCYYGMVCCIGYQRRKWTLC